MMKPPYEYCAVRFLDQWNREERRLHALLSTSPTPDAVRKALRHFQVARGFPDLREKATTVANALCEASKRLNEQNVVARVTHLAERFVKEFGSRNLSAASKRLGRMKQTREKTVRLGFKPKLTGTPALVRLLQFLPSAQNLNYIKFAKLASKRDDPHGPDPPPLT